MLFSVIPRQRLCHISLKSRDKGAPWCFKLYPLTDISNKKLQEKPSSRPEQVVKVIKLRPCWWTHEQGSFPVLQTLKNFSVFICITRLAVFLPDMINCEAISVSTPSISLSQQWYFKPGLKVNTHLPTRTCTDARHIFCLQWRRRMCAYEQRVVWISVHIHTNRLHEME